MTATAQQFRTYVERNLDILGADPTRTAVVHHDRRVTAGELRDLVHRMARALRARGVERGQVVTLLSGNLPETIAARYAANLIGCAVNHLYNKLSADVQATIMRDVETRALIADPAYAGRAAELAELTGVQDVLLLGPGSEGTDLLELAAGQPAEPLSGLARPEDICMIRHTGGTTGHPKAICTAFERLPGFQDDVDEILEPEGKADDGMRQLVCTTLAHAAGLLADVTLRTDGGTVVLLDDFDAAEALAAIERERITHMFLLPPLLYQLMDHPDVDSTDTSSLRNVTYGGCQSSPARLASAVRRFGHVLTQFYGQNEAGGISVLSPEDHDPENPARLRTAGKAMNGVEIAIRDESGRDLPTGEHGEVCVRSEHIMTGYWKQPELTAEVLRDGWLHTGDIGFLDDEGYLTIVDRIKDMIVVVGGHVYTTELEDLLNTHPEVLQSAVFGVPDANRMEQVYAAVVRAPGSELDEKELREFVGNERGAMYEPAHVSFIDALPLTDAGKPDKKFLRREAEAAAATR
ncbi:fatty acid--CoA ligase [Streptosporangium nondiastaticum]|uniref:Fatty acid--CoA ligase n=2 Tax=Actinomycetes TaxID=1760 RepID=A0A9X7JQ58_9ACTN|nr:AMP-binding protein [Streptosporangium nondiastaticum]PSJ27815.1 fatty acid--CoA ligase [Streptosporangium nondiastaticum]